MFSENTFGKNKQPSHRKMEKIYTEAEMGDRQKKI